MSQKYNIVNSNLFRFDYDVDRFFFPVSIGIEFVSYNKIFDYFFFAVSEVQKRVTSLRKMIAAGFFFKNHNSSHFHMYKRF